MYVVLVIVFNVVLHENAIDVSNVGCVVSQKVDYSTMRLNYEEDMDQNFIEDVVVLDYD